MMMTKGPIFTALLDYLAKIPAVATNSSESRGLNTGFEAGVWWVKFRINIDHSTGWSVVQELAYVLNELSLTERLPTVFKPVSPPPYLNGGPRHCLFWVIECPLAQMAPETVQQWLEGRLPRPVDNLEQWNLMNNE